MATQSETTESSGPSQTGEIKKFIDAFNAELEKIYKDESTKLGPWKNKREEAIKITKPRLGTWPVDPAVKTIGDLFAYVFFDPDGVNYKTPPYFIKSNGINAYVDDALKQQYGDWIDDMNGVSVSDPSIGVVFKSLAWPYPNNNWTGNERNSTRPIVLSDSAQIIQNYNEIKKPGITNPDKYSAGQWWFDMFMSDVIGLDGLSGYLKSSKWVDDDPRYNGLKVIWGSNNSKIEEIFPEKFLDNNKKTEKSFQYWGNIGSDSTGNTTYSDPVYEDTDVYTISVSKFVKEETVPFPIDTYKYDRHNYSDYGATKDGRGFGFAQILKEIGGGGYQGFDIRDFDGLKTQYRPGVNSLESLSKDPLFNPGRTNWDDIEWEGTGTQSQETGIYWNYYVEEGKTASVVGKNEDILLYNAFLEAGDNYQTVTLPKKAPEPKVEPPVVSPLVPTTESKLSGEFTFNVEKKDTFVVVGNQNFALKIGDLVIEGLTTSSTPVIESPKTIDLGDGIIIIDDGESGEDIYSESDYQGFDGVDEPAQLNIVFEEAALKMMNEKNSEGEQDTSIPGGGSMLGKVNVDYKVNGSNWGKVKKGMDDASLLRAMVSYIEGGYYYPGHAYSKFSEKDRGLYGSSGETLWGIDRHAGQTENTSEGKLFWAEVDKLSGYGSTTGKTGYARKTATRDWNSSSYPTKPGGWSYNYSPKPGSAGYDIMYNSFVKYASSHLETYLNSYFKSHPVKSLILSDSRMKFLWFRSTWNGVGWFSWYATGKSKKGIKGLMWAYDNVTKNPDELIVWDLNNRLKFGNSLITHDVKKMAELLGIDKNGSIA
jgi:hypothetical protein